TPNTATIFPYTTLFRSINDENETKENSFTDEDDSLEDLTKVQLEARVYANKIKEWLGYGDNKPLQIFDKDEETMRNVKYKDIVIDRKSTRLNSSHVSIS